jgi:hypothetical protein
VHQALAGEHIFRVCAEATLALPEQARQEAALAAIRAALVKRWPECKVHLFGSTANQLSICNNNDIDVCLELPDLPNDLARTPAPTAHFSCLFISLFSRQRLGHLFHWPPCQAGSSASDAVLLEAWALGAALAPAFCLVEGIEGASAVGLGV